MPKGGKSQTPYLVKQKPKWKHLPSKAVRVPEIFLGEIQDYAIALDNGYPLDGKPQASAPQKNELNELNVETVQNWINQQNIETLLKLETHIALAIARRKEEDRDNRLEDALIFLGDRCDGAMREDGAGFNGADTGFGKWLAGRARAKVPIQRDHAKAALKMLSKYQRTQLKHLELPEWEAIAHQYPEVIISQVPIEELPIHRIEIKGEEIAVYSPYDETGRMQRTAKSISKYRFNGADKSWRYPLEKIEEVLEKFPDYEKSEEVEGAIALLEMQRAEEDARVKAEAEATATHIVQLVEAADLDSPLENGWTLFDHQKEGAKWLLSHCEGGIYKGGILADQMGLGKTIETLTAAKAMKKVHDCYVFVVCPASLRENWGREAQKVGVEIETYSWAKMPKPLEIGKYLLIGDESHYIQNIKSKRCQNFLELAHHENCLGAWLLTGTPMKNGRPINLYPLLLAVGHPLADDRWGYERYYCNAHQKSIGKRTVWDNSGAAFLDELSKKTEDVILRRTKTECLDLPDKLRTLVPIELKAKEEKAYNSEIQKLVKNYRDRAKAGLVDPDAEALVTLNYLRKVGSEFKVNAAVEMAQEILETGESVILFTEFIESAIAIHARLGGELLTGATKQDERQALVDRFQFKESKVFVGTIKAGGVGLTLTASSNVILVDRPWTPGDAEQAEDRAHRIGANSTVTAFWLQLGIIDNAIDNLLESKSERIELVLQGKRKTLRGLSSPKELAKELLELL